MSNVLTELPVVGDGVAVLDKAFVDMGLSAFVSLTFEFVAMVFVLVVVGKIVITRLVPLLAGTLVGPLVALAKVLAFVLLAPQAAFVAGGRRPGPLVYAYGAGIERASKAMQAGAQALPTKFEGLRRVPRIAVLGVVIGLFFLWNSTYCSDTAQCVSPISQWTTAAEAWSTSGGA